MQELINKLLESGLTDEQARNSVEALKEWLNEQYPVAGTLVSAYLTREELTP